jgi:hypothetical protein
MTFEERVEKAFNPAYEEFLLDDVGFVKFHRFGTNPKENWGIIESGNGDVLFYTKNVREFGFYGASKPCRDFVALTGPLQQGQPVTYRVQKNHQDERLRAPEVVLWQPPRFEEIRLQILNRPVYRFVSLHPVSGGLGSVSETSASKDVLWKGKNLFTLRRMYPQDKWPTRKGDVSGRGFERLNKNEEWEACNDPR